MQGHTPTTPAATSSRLEIMAFPVIANATATCTPDFHSSIKGYRETHQGSKRVPSNPANIEIS